MKKSIIALAVAGAVAVPAVAMADATLYGRLHFQLQFDKDKDFNVANAGHRLGVKGDSQMDSGLTAFYQLETQYNNDKGSARKSNSSTDAADITVRHANAGVKGDFGTATVGRFTNPMTSTYVADVFERNSGVYEQAPYRVGNALAYTTPNMSGFDGYVGIIGEGEGSDTQYKDVDGYIVGGNYSVDGLYVGLGYMTADYTKAADGKTKDLTFGVSYTVDNLYVAYNYEKATTGVAKVDTKVHDFAVTYAIDKTTLGLGYARAKTDNQDTKKRTLVGVYHNLGGNADVYAEYADYNKGDRKSVV